MPLKAHISCPSLELLFEFFSFSFNFGIWPELLLYTLLFSVNYHGIKGHKRNFCADKFENKYPSSKERKKRRKQVSQEGESKEGMKEKEMKKEGRQGTCTFHTKYSY